jgi:hypothetical protein
MSDLSPMDSHDVTHTGKATSKHTEKEVWDI